MPFTATALLSNKELNRSDGHTVHLFCVMPVYQDEADMARRFIPDFLNALDRTGTSRVLNVQRKSVAGE